MLLKDFIKDGIAALSGLYPKEEARSMIMFYCADVLGFPSYQHITEPKTEVPAELLEQALDDVRRLSEAEPLQYVLGYTEFCGRTFKVDHRALIPRVETELLCMKAEEMAPKKDGLKILDLCTGSGCIAWTLAMDLPGAEVTATDLSEEALELASEQFKRLSRKVVRPRFVKADLLDIDGTIKAAAEPSFDVITANPPYVMNSEKVEMRPNVLGWEPHMAIFAPDRDPLAFHKAIAIIALKLLAPGGCAVVELNTELAEETATVFKNAGFSSVEIIRDFFDRPRFVSFRK